jgi:enoyl-CoA hydratase/carnithine racemase
VTAPQFPDEVVTHAHVRYVQVPGLDGEIALVTLDNGHDHTRPSTFGPAGLASLDAALDEIEAHQPAVAAVAVTGKPFVFAVGADVTGIPLVADRDTAVEIGRAGHRVFRRLRNSAVPTFAFVNGAAMGGGLEIALHCHYARCPVRPRRWRCPRCSSAWCRAGAARSCCPTWSARPTR